MQPFESHNLINAASYEADDLKGSYSTTGAAYNIRQKS
jgi:hypothetical protein